MNSVGWRCFEITLVEVMNDTYWCPPERFALIFLIRFSTLMRTTDAAKVLKYDHNTNSPMSKGIDYKGHLKKAKSTARYFRLLYTLCTVRYKLRNSFNQQSQMTEVKRLLEAACLEITNDKITYNRGLHRSQFFDLAKSSRSKHSWTYGPTWWAD